MTGFHAEEHLRLIGERMLLSRDRPGQPPWNSPLTAAAETLVALGALPVDTAQWVLDDYLLAGALREQGHLPHRRVVRSSDRAGAQPPAVVEPRRLVPCHRTVEQAWGQVHIDYVSLGLDSTTMAVTVQLPQGPPGARSPRFGRPPTRSPRETVPVISVRDDHGRSALGHFTGGGDDREWNGQFRLRPPLARDTRWIDLLGERVELVDELPPVEVRIEPVTSQDPARRLVWQRVEELGGLFAGPGVLETVIDVVVAAGALAADDPAIAEATAVARSLHPYADLLGAVPRDTPVPALPEPWRTLLAGRGRDNGPVGATMVGATTPAFDGVSVAVIRLQSDQREFQTEVEIVGAPPPRGSSQLFRSRLTWWADDDRGNPYLGTLNGSHWNEELTAGHVSFWPALDPQASRLDLIPTATAARAVIRVPLPWTRRP